MTPKKVLLTTMVCVPLLFAKCQSNKEEVEPIKANTNWTYSAKPDFERKAQLIKFGNALETAIGERYLQENIKENKNLQDIDYLRQKIESSYNSLSHAYAKKSPTKIPNYNVSELSLNQLQRIYLMYQYLKDSSSRKEIGNIIKSDVKDAYAEHGGIILINKSKIKFKTLESDAERSVANNRIYSPPKEAFNTPKIGDFHLHAESYNEGASASPSGNPDITLSYLTVDAKNEDHEFLITPISKGKFNMDYYGGDKQKNIIIKIFDLGNFSYDTLSIK